jgi:hypothetical protein
MTMSAVNKHKDRLMMEFITVQYQSFAINEAKTGRSHEIRVIGFDTILSSAFI